MRHHLFRAAVLTATLALPLTATAAVTSAAGAAAATAPTAAAAQPPSAARIVFLLTGERVAMGAGGTGQPSLLPATTSSAGQLQALNLGGRHYLVPITAVPYLGRGLDPALFDAATLARAESAGRLPVRVTYSGSRPALPGVTITSAGTGSARGYLTAAGAGAFGAALGRQFAADHADGGYGQNGLFAGGVSIAAAGHTAAAARPGHIRPRFAMHTLAIRGTAPSGGADTGDIVTLVDADKASLFWTPGQDTLPFDHGVAKFSVPTGHFWAIAQFVTFKDGAPSASYLDLPAEFTVTKNMTLRVAASAAASRVQFVTARPATVQSQVFELDLLTDHAPHGCCASDQNFISEQRLKPGGGTLPALPLYVSPMATPPGTGTLTQITFAQLSSPSTAKGVPYHYALAYQSQGTIPPQRFVVNQSALATDNVRYYSAAPQTGYLAHIQSFPINRYLGSLFLLSPTSFPLRQTLYLTAKPGLTWTTKYVLYGKVLDFVGGQNGLQQPFLPGQRLTEDWGSYPLHPVPDVKLAKANGTTRASATRAGDTLGLALTSFGDNTPGHTGSGIGRPFKPTGSYEIDQNGTKIAGGMLPRFNGFFDVRATLSPARSHIRVVLNAAQPATLSPLSVASQTAWTWWSAHESGQALPSGWVCAAAFNRACAAQPMLTLRYGVLGESLTGATAPGQQVVRVWAGHMQPAEAAKITKAAVSVSFDGGKTWQPAQLTGGDGNYAAVFNAPAGAMVTLKTSATDAAGGSVSQTITDAYQTAATTTASGAPIVRAACPVAGPRQARCDLLYGPQYPAGVPPASSKPVGWGATDIESAYQLPVSHGAGQTVALVDAFSTPHLASDLAVYRKQYGLPACTTASGCLRIVNQQGKTSPLPAADPTGWGVEETADVSMVSAACPLCKIIVVEAKTPTFANLAEAEDTAARLGAQVISNSYGARESGFTQAEKKHYEHAGHTIVASSGDEGFTAAQFPANLADVTAVGGTQLARVSGGRGWAESVWNNNFGASGSGCSAYVAKPAWQHDPHCPGRTSADVAALASKVALYDSSIPAAQGGPWLTVYGTSLAAPIVAGVYALAGNATTVRPGYAYTHTSSLFDVAKGNNDWFQRTHGAACGYDYLCVAKPGYDAPTGLGTPDGTGAF